VPRDLADVKADHHDEEAAEAEPRPGPGERLRAMLWALDERFPRLSQWFGGRLDIELPALAISAAFHLALLLMLGVVGYTVQKEAGWQLQASSIVDAKLTDLERSNFQDLDQSAEPTTSTPRAGSFAPNLATVTIATVSTNPIGTVAANPAATVGSGSVDLSKLDVQRATEAIVPSATMFGQTLSIRGNGSEHVGTAEGAVDRVAEEVVRRMEKGRTLVVWAFDASLSLDVERDRLAKHISTVYTHIAQLDHENRAAAGGLLTAVVAFGADRQAMTRVPTADPAAITAAIRAVPPDTSGVETTFGTVADIVRKWGHYKDPKGNLSRTMVIVVTDERGDDEMRVEEAIEVATRAKVPVYVLGSAALFGRAEGFIDYTDPKTGYVHHHLRVDQGPESAMIEQIKLPFWYGGPQYDELDSGFGPYALARLAGATGGIYFVTRLGPTRMGFDPGALREYKPDWVSRAKYEADVTSHPVRKAVLDAAVFTQQNLPGMPSLNFPPIASPEFNEAMEQNQAIAARTASTVDAALEPINEAVKLRDRETSRRWQAHYDLIRGRLLAMKVRCYEYNWACARMKTDPPRFTRPDSNAWSLAPDTEIHSSDKAADAGKQAVALLKKVVADHPNTPWALLAQRELKDPMGFKWVEAHVQPVVPDNNAGEAAAAKKDQPNNTPPPEPPKL
jgi:hypothetical protein